MCWQPRQFLNPVIPPGPGFCGAARAAPLPPPAPGWWARGRSHQLRSRREEAVWGQAQGPRGRGLVPRLLRPGLTWMCRGRGGCGFSCEPHVHTEKPPSQHPRSCLSAGPVSSFGFLPGLWRLGWGEGAPAGDLLRAAVWQLPWLSASPPSPGSPQ